MPSISLEQAQQVIEQALDGERGSSDRLIAAAVCDAGAHRLRWRAKMARHRKPGLDRGFELNRL